MTNSSKQYCRESFLECEWSYSVLPEDHYGYSSVMRCLQKSSEEKLESGQEKQARILSLLSRAASMMIVPESINSPFQAYAQNFETGMRSTLPEDFTEEEWTFFEEILSDVTESLLKARLADLLWLYKKPRDPNDAMVAIEAYISHDIDSDTWHRDVNDCWERAARLCIQLRDFEKLDSIKNQLFSAFEFVYTDSKLMNLWIASLMDKLKVDSDFREAIASNLSKSANNLFGEGDFYSARSYFELSAKKYKQAGDEKGWLGSLVSIGECFEREGDLRVDRSKLAANSFYENAIQAYRKIPTKFREDYNVNVKIKETRKKISVSGKESLDEMVMIKSPEIDITELVEEAIAHVSGKSHAEEALAWFSGVHSVPNYDEFCSDAKENMKKNIFSSLIGGTQMSEDGRVTAKIPSMNIDSGEDDPAYKAVLNKEVQQLFSIDVNFVVKGQILPALRQILKEHRISKNMMRVLCQHSPIVPQDREYLLGFAIWLGFEHDFVSSIHLLCPQVEHIVRMKLKEAGAHTSKIDLNGIETENGLSTLMDLPEAVQVFGEDLCFELKSIFTDSMGFNYRNEVAHGLMDDSPSNATIYAWWMVFRLVVHSMIGIDSLNSGTESDEEPCLESA